MSDVVGQAGHALSAEQRARDLLERCGVEDAQSLSAGDVVELANLIAEVNRLRAAADRIAEIAEDSEADRKQARADGDHERVIFLRGERTGLFAARDLLRGVR